MLPHHIILRYNTIESFKTLRTRRPLCNRINWRHILNISLQLCSLVSVGLYQVAEFLDQISGGIMLESCASLFRGVPFVGSGTHVGEKADQGVFAAGGRYLGLAMATGMDYLCETHLVSSKEVGFGERSISLLAKTVSL